MRSCSLLCFLLTLAGFCVAQSTNFPVGPQYLMNYGSPMFLQPIATPTLSLSAPPASASVPASEPVAAPGTSALETPSAELPVRPNFARIYWGGPKATEAASSETASETASVVEISGTAPTNLPASIVNVGVQETVDAQSLRERGYGVTVAEASSFWKTHKPRAPRVYTNRDIDRLHGGM
jgi:hypothetical protein